MGTSPPFRRDSPRSERTNGKAILSLGLGLGGILFCLVSPLAIYLGHKALKEIRASGGSMSGLGAAQAGIALGWIGTVFLAFIMWIASIYLRGWFRGEYP